MHDPSEPVPAPPPARRRGPRHAAPEDAPGPGPEGPPRRVPAAVAGHRAAAHRRGRTSGSGSRRGRWISLATAAVAVTAVLAVGLVRSDDTSPDTTGSLARDPSGAPAALVEWVLTQLPDGGTVATSPGLRAALLRAGADAETLPESSAARGGEPGIPELAVVESPPPGSRVLARFESGAGAGPLLLVDPAPVEPSDEQRERRETLAAAVLANPTTRVEGDARAVLAAADVDPRLLSLVAGLTARDGVGLREFPSLPGEEPGAAPARRLVIDATGGRPVPADAAATERLVAWLAAQLPPFAPDLVEVTGDGVLVAFDYVPGPDAVVSAATP